MIKSKLIVGGNKEEREKIAQRMAEKIIGKLLCSPHPDFIVVNGKGSIGINQIREVERQLFLKPYSAPAKVVLFLEAERLTLPAQNALLKIIESPPDHSFIIFTTPHPSFLLPTVISRCEIIRIKPETKINMIKEEKINQIIKMRVGERLKIATLYSSTKTQATEFLYQLLLECRQQMIREPSIKKARFINLILKTLIIIQKNVNPILATGNLLINLV